MNVRLAVAIWVAALFLAGCGMGNKCGPHADALGTACGVGRCGAYADTPGTARITVIEVAPADQNNCLNDPVRVLFDFTPTDPAQAPLAASGVALTIGSGQNPPRSWVAASGLTVGGDLPATRSDQAVGPCTPVVWKFPTLDEAAGLASCYQ